MIRREKKPARAAARPTGPRAADDFDAIGARLKELEAADIVVDCGDRPVFECPVFIGVDMARATAAWEIEFEKTLPGREYAVLFIAPDGTLLGPGVGFGVDARAGYCIRENGIWREANQLDFEAAIERERQAARMPQVKRLDPWDDKTWNGMFGGPSKAASIAPEQDMVSRAMRDMLELGVGRERIYMAPRQVGKTHSANLHHLRSCALKELLDLIAPGGSLVPAVSTVALQAIIDRARSLYPRGGDDDGGTQEKG